MLRIGAVGLMVAAVVASLGIAGACTPEEGGDFGSPDTSLGEADVPTDALTRIAVTVTGENILALLDTTYDALIEIGQVAQSRAQDSLVRGIASEALVRHRQLRDENLQIAIDVDANTRLVEDEPVEGHREAMAALQQRTGAAFDSLYLARSIETHETLLEQVREALTMPGTERVRDHLRRVQATLDTDLRNFRQANELLGARS